MIENIANSFKDVLSKAKEVKEYVPLFFDKLDCHGLNEKVDIYEPVSKKGKGELTEFQKEVLMDDYGVSYEEIGEISSWEEVEKSELNEDAKEKLDLRKNCPIENGRWEGDRGDSKWIPDSDYVPQKKNPEQKTWREILDEFGIDGIDFKDGEPDFSEISKGNVEIEPFSTNRDDNFDRADKELAKQRGCTPEEVEKWRKENGYTWHECRDMKTMQKVPSIIHNNVSHRGGISEAKGGD